MPSPRHLVCLLIASGLAACSGAEAQDVLAVRSSPSAGGSSGDDSSGGASSGGAVAPLSCAQEEEEPNDDKGHADVLAPELCGTVSRADRDYLTFKLHPTTKALSIHFTGRIRLRVDVKGEETTELTPGSSGDVPFVAKERYFVEVTSLSDVAGEVPWRVAIVEDD